MTKNKKTTPQNITIWAGYILFAAFIVSVILSTVIPFGGMLFNPNVKHYNAAVILVALTAGAILPAISAYFIGDGSVRSKDKAKHHFNGVLFGLLSYWLMGLFAIPMADLSISIAAMPVNLRVILVNASIILGVVIVTTIIAVAHVRSRNSKKDIIEYGPYQYVLLGAILIPLLWSLMHTIATQSIDLYALIQPAILILFGSIAYATLRKVKMRKVVRLTWAAVSVTVLMVTVFVFSQLMTGVSYMLANNISHSTFIVISIVEFLLALGAWIVYWRLMVRGLTKKHWFGKHA